MKRATLRERQREYLATRREKHCQGLGDRRRDEVAPTGQKTERIFREIAAEAGWEVTKRGWPDFILRKPGELVFVEVKSDPETKLKKEQQEVAELLTVAGFKVYRWDPISGFTRIQVEGLPRASGDHRSPPRKRVQENFLKDSS